MDKFTFNAQSEKQRDLADGKGYFYETDFRGYDAQIGRFHGYDLLASAYSGISPYQFGFNNPVMFNDPTGLEAEDAEDDGGGKRKKNRQRRKNINNSGGTLTGKIKKDRHKAQEARREERKERREKRDERRERRAESNEPDNNGDYGGDKHENNYFFMTRKVNNKVEYNLTQVKYDRTTEYKKHFFELKNSTDFAHITTHKLKTISITLDENGQIKDDVTYSYVVTKDYAFKYENKEKLIDNIGKRLGKDINNPLIDKNLRGFHKVLTNFINQGFDSGVVKDLMKALSYHTESDASIGLVSTFLGFIPAIRSPMTAFSVLWSIRQMAEEFRTKYTLDPQRLPK